MRKHNEYNIWLADNDPYRWTRYNEMMSKRIVIDFNRPGFCKRCGRREGDHLTELGLKQNPNACRFESN